MVTMRRMKLPLSLVGLMAWSLTASAQDDVIRPRYRWIPGETLRYRTVLESTATVEGRSVVTLAYQEDTVFEVRGRTRTGAELAFHQGEVKVQMELILLGQELSFVVNRDRMLATLNGDPLPEPDSESLQRDMVPLQHMMRTPIRLMVTEQGKVFRLMGLETLDEETRQEVALSLLEGMEVPLRPLRTGESFTQVRHLSTFLPRASILNTAHLPGLPVHLTRRLAALESGSGGGLLARIEGRFSHSLRNLTVNGRRVDIIPDMEVTTWFDLTHGRLLREVMSGSMRLLPHAKSPAVTLTIRGQVTLMEKGRR